ncbi:MAG TPA: DUF6688 family protein [Bacteroidia bacterium]|jgi:hypothetical protein
MGAFIFLPFVYLAIIAFIVTVCIRSIIYKPVDPSRGAWGFLLCFEVIFTVIAPAIGFLRYDKFGPEIPFSTHHIHVIILLTFLSSGCFWIVKMGGHSLKGIMKQVLASGIAAGIVLCVITAIHFGKYNLNGLFFPLAGFELLSPFICIFILYKELYNLYATPPSAQAFHPGVLDAPVSAVPLAQRLVDTRSIARAFIMAVPFIIAVALLNMAAGGSPDAFIKAFTESQDFVFSKLF